MPTGKDELLFNVDVLPKIVTLVEVTLTGPVVAIVDFVPSALHCCHC